MANTIDMQDMRYLNLFEKITRIRTRFCFKYNNMIIFCVPKNLVLRAVGENMGNIKRLNEIMRKRIRIISAPRGIQDVKFFIQSIINPVTFKGVEVKDNEIILTAGGTQNKAALIGRNKRRLLEMQKIIKNYFSKEIIIA
jgi:transcription antitermination factor NusA-like protein